MRLPRAIVLFTLLCAVFLSPAFDLVQLANSANELEKRETQDIQYFISPDLQLKYPMLELLESTELYLNPILTH